MTSDLYWKGKRVNDMPIEDLRTAFHELCAYHIARTAAADETVRKMSEIAELRRRRDARRGASFDAAS